MKLTDFLYKTFPHNYEMFSIGIYFERVSQGDCIILEAVKIVGSGC